MGPYLPSYEFVCLKCDMWYGVGDEPIEKEGGGVALLEPQ